MPVTIGDLIHGKYRILRIIGQGGMGTVFEGQNESIARRVAIKVLHSDQAENAATAERFEREAQAAGRIGNDHILEVLDSGLLDNGERFMVMEYLDGQSLEERLEKRTRLTALESYWLIRQLLFGLSAAHDAGIIHRDLKPDNIFILREKVGHPDFVKIIDFGISKFTSGSHDLRMTATGAVMGTPYYMAPEQARGSRDADARSDVYAVGVILFRCISGQVPFDAGSFNELLFKIVLGETPHVSSLVPDVDPAFDALIYRAMARDPSDRFQSAIHLLRALDEWRDGLPADESRPADRRDSRPSANSNSARRSGQLGHVESTAGLDATPRGPSSVQVFGSTEAVSVPLEATSPGSSTRSNANRWLGAGLSVVTLAAAALFWSRSDGGTAQPAAPANSAAVSLQVPTQVNAQTPAQATPKAAAPQPNPAAASSPTPLAQPNRAAGARTPAKANATHPARPVQAKPKPEAPVAAPANNKDWVDY